MDNGKISVRYARALFETAKEQQCETEVYEQPMRLTGNYSQAIGAFDEALSNPIIASEEKVKLLKTAIGDPIHPCLARFIEFVSEKKRENKILLIALKYQEMYRKEENLLKAEVTTAAEIDDQAVQRIRQFVEQTFNRRVEMHLKTNPELIGGFILDIEHNRMDSSVKGLLEKIKKDELLTRPEGVPYQ